MNNNERMLQSRARAPLYKSCRALIRGAANMRFTLVSERSCIEGS